MHFAPITQWRPILRRIWVIGGLLITAWLFLSYRATGFDPALLQSNERVTVTDTPNTLIFRPIDQDRPGALIFYPGSMVEPTAYAPLLRAVADAGHLAILVRLPLRAAPLEAHKLKVMAQTQTILAEEPPAHAWIVAGHSFGGVMAARFARDHPALIDGLFLIGTSHPRDFDLSHAPFDVTKVYGTRDGLASEPEIQANAHNLPPSTHWVRIQGANHSQFGWYGSQLGDNAATISRQDQQHQLLTALLTALERIEPSQE